MNLVDKMFRLTTDRHAFVVDADHGETLQVIDNTGATQTLPRELVEACLAAGTLIEVGEIPPRAIGCRRKDATTIRQTT